MFIVLLSNIVKGSSHTKCISLSNQKYDIQPTLINLHSNQYTQEFHYYLFAVKLDRCVGRCNTLNDLSNKVCVLNKTEDLNLSVVNMITGINESNISRECKCKFDCRKCNSDKWSNNNKCGCEWKKHHICEKDCVWNPATCNCENGKYSPRVLDKIICDLIIDVKETNFNYKI